MGTHAWLAAGGRLHLLPHLYRETKKGLQGFTGSESLPIDEVARSEPGTQCSLGYEGYP